MRSALKPAPTTLILLHSPLVGPEFWRPVASALCRRGLLAYAPRLPSLEYSYAPFWLAHAAGIANGLPEQGDLILAAHSAAGVLLPAIGRLHRNREVAARICGYLFIDADLPRDGATRLELWDDRGAAERLRERVGTGNIPRFTDAQLRALIVDDDQREAFLSTLPQVPMHFYDEAIMVPEDWPDASCAYLQLSANYPGSEAHARSEGWPLQALQAHHFAPLTDVDGVAGVLLDMCRQLTEVHTQ